MDGGVEPSTAATPVNLPKPGGARALAALEWLVQRRALTTARAQIASEAAEHRSRRERCRELFDAAEQLSVNARSAPQAQAALHAEALRAENLEVPATLDGARERHAALLAELEAAQRAHHLAWRRRLSRLTAVLGLALGLAIAADTAIERVTAKPNLLIGKAWKTSSTLGTCKPAEHSCAGVTTDIFFHTNWDTSPWLEYELGSPTTFSRLYVRNRQDSLPDRAVPLVAEVSDDEKTWKEVAKREQTFSEWSVGFPPVTAKFFRLRVEKPTWFHLEAVELKP